MTRQAIRIQRGLSLIEATVALAVMAFGMLGVVGLQSTLRLSSDVSKQRSEAVRKVQEVVEQRRSFSLVTSAPGFQAFDDLVTQVDVDSVGTNATFTLAETVSADTEALPMKTVTVAATWQDRASAAQTASITTVLARSSPAVAAALVVPPGGGAAQLPQGRNSIIPQGATDLGNGTSSYSPPGAPPGTSWTFSNGSGDIIETCSPTCTTVNARLLQGFVRYATSFVAPLPSDAANPPSTPFYVGVSVDVTGSACFADIPTGALYLEYVCAVPLSGLAWTGTSTLTGLSLVSAIASTDSLLYRVCRYTPERAQTAVGSDATTFTPVRKIANTDHPLHYVGVTTALTSQNFLVIRGGDNSTPFDCPDDDSAVPGNTRTYHHQPSV